MISSLLSKYFPTYFYSELIESAIIAKYELAYYILRCENEDNEYIAVIDGRDTHDDQESVRTTAKSVEEHAGVQIIAWKVLNKYAKTTQKEWLSTQEVEGNLSPIISTTSWDEGSQTTHMVAKIKIGSQLG